MGTLTKGLDANITFDPKLEGDWLEKWNWYIKPFYQSKCLKPTLSEKTINHVCHLLRKLDPYIDRGLMLPTICMGGNRTVAIYWNRYPHNLNCKIDNSGEVEFIYKNKYYYETVDVKIVVKEPFNDKIINFLNKFL